MDPAFAFPFTNPMFAGVPPEADWSSSYLFRQALEEQQAMLTNAIAVNLQAQRIMFEGMVHQDGQLDEGLRGKSNIPSFKRLQVMEDRSYASACAKGQNPAAPWRWFTLWQMPSFGRADILCTTRHFQFKAVAFSSRFRMHFSRVSSRHSDLRGVRGRPWFDLVGRCFCPDSFLVACSNFICQAD